MSLLFEAKNRIEVLTNQSSSRFGVKSEFFELEIKFDRARDFVYCDPNLGSDLFSGPF